MDPAQIFEQAALARHQAVLQNFGDDSEIKKCYENSTVVVTGFAGFIGKHLVEKLIRSCDIKRAYLIIRPKKGKTIEERLENIVNDPVFNTLRNNGIDFKNRLIPIYGDMQEIGLSISSDDWKKLTEETEYIFHVAATVNFVEHIKIATLTNVRGTKEMVNLARKCKNLRAFVHVSTAYSHATKDRIDKEVLEEFYSSPVPPDLMINIVETFDDELLEKMTLKLLQKWPNTYTFTKAIAEDLIREASQDLPVCVVRPAIVINSYKDPIPGWLDPTCAYGASGLILGGGYGAMHVLLTNESVRIDLVPVDYVNNAVIAGGWAAKKNEAKIYNVATARSGILWEKKLRLLNTEVVDKYMAPKAMWYYFMINTANIYYFKILSWFLHYIPGYLIDGVFWTIGKPVIAIKLYTKVSKLQEVLSYFTLNEWNFIDANLEELYSRLTETDKIIFDCNITNVDWQEHTILWGLGVRKYLMKDGLENTKQAIKNQFWFKILHYIVLAVYVYVIWKILCFSCYVLRYVCSVF